MAPPWWGIGDGEARPAQVAVTWTRRRVDIAGLAWIHGR